MQSITDQIKRWLGAEGDVLFKSYSHAKCALLTDHEVVTKLNEAARREAVDWVIGQQGWPDDEWIIGEDGRGGYYVVSKSAEYEGVRYYDHETRTIEPYQPTLRDFFDLCLDIERSGPRFKAQLRETLIQYVEQELGFKPTERTRFFWGTGTDGLDAEQFMVDFAKAFGIDMSSFDGAAYGLEEHDLGTGLRHVVNRSIGRSAAKTRHFTIDHLVEVLLQQKWFDPPVI